MVKSFAVKPASGGFGEYEVSCEGVTFDNLESVDEYISLVLQENRLIRSYSTDPDEDEESLATVALRDLKGNVLGQGSGTLVAFNVSGAVQVDCVFVS